MKNSYIRIAITALVLVLLVLAGTYLFTTELTIPGLEFSTKTISGFIDTTEQYTKSEETYKSAINQQKTKLDELRKTESSYEEAKRKYENLTDDTINTVKEANKTEKYSIEYLWVRLGDYAKKHNVEIMIVDPSSTVSQGSTSTDANGNATTDANGNPVTDPNSTDTSMGPQANILKVQVIGSYMNIADYIYVIENDSTLRFKLDNIKMEATGDGNKVRVSFGVKNLQIVK